MNKNSAMEGKHRKKSKRKRKKWEKPAVETEKMNLKESFGLWTGEPDP